MRVSIFLFRTLIFLSLTLNPTETICSYETFCNKSIDLLAKSDVLLDDIFLTWYTVYDTLHNQRSIWISGKKINLKIWWLLWIYYNGCTVMLKYVAWNANILLFFLFFTDFQMTNFSLWHWFGGFKLPIQFHSFYFIMTYVPTSFLID